MEHLCLIEVSKLEILWPQTPSLSQAALIVLLYHYSFFKPIWCQGHWAVISITRHPRRLCSRLSRQTWQCCSDSKSWGSSTDSRSSPWVDPTIGESYLRQRTLALLVFSLFKILKVQSADDGCLVDGYCIVEWMNSQLYFTASQGEGFRTFKKIKDQRCHTGKSNLVFFTLPFPTFFFS